MEWLHVGAENYTYRSLLQKQQMLVTSDACVQTLEVNVFIKFVWQNLPS